MPVQKRKIALRSRLHRARYRCPNGHTNWEAINGHWWCQACANNWDVEPAFTELRDKKTGETLQRDEVTLFDDDHVGADAERYKGRG